MKLGFGKRRGMAILRPNTYEAPARQGVKESPLERITS